jgi:hypothetical protein
MAEDEERFLSRWSRLKQEDRAERAAPAAGKKQGDKPLPPLESLTPQSDFSAFMQPNVKEELRRLALKKLFQDPHFNVPDPFEPYSRDWNLVESLPPDMLAKLNQARTVLLTPEERQALEEKERQETQAPAAAETKPQETKAHEPGSENT